MKRLLKLFTIAVIAGFVVVMLYGCAGPVKSERELKSGTENMQSIIQSKLANLNNAVSEAAKKIAKGSLKGEETREILNGLCKKYPYLADCSTADPDGEIITIAPEAYRRYEGMQTATTESAKQFQRDFIANRKPVLSKTLSAVEGFDAVVLLWPVITENGELLGSVSALFKPEVLLGGVIKYQAEVRAMEVNVMQTDGLIIYSSKGTETGKNMFTDPSYQAYPELLSLGAKIVAEQKGSGTYSFTSHATGQTTKKTAVWTSAGLHGADWRITGIAELTK